MTITNAETVTNYLYNDRVQDYNFYTPLLCYMCGGHNIVLLSVADVLRRSVNTLPARLCLKSIYYTHPIHCIQSSHNISRLHKSPGIHTHFPTIRVSQTLPPCQTTITTLCTLIIIIIVILRGRHGVYVYINNYIYIY